MKFEPGYVGKDAMRSKAEKMIATGQPVGFSRKGMSKEQSDMVLPKLVKKTTQETVRLPFKKGGHASKKKKPAKKMMGGCMNYASGGNVYEREMVGEKPSNKPRHFNYESDMKGEKPVRKPMAMGGVGKLKKGVKSPAKRKSPADM